MNEISMLIPHCAAIDRMAPQRTKFTGELITKADGKQYVTFTGNTRTLLNTEKFQSEPAPQGVIYVAPEVPANV